MKNRKHRYNYIANVVLKVGLEDINSWILKYNEEDPTINTDDLFYLVFKCIKTLSDSLKLLFITWILCDYDFKQTSDKLNIPAPTIYAYINRIKKYILLNYDIC